MMRDPETEGYRVGLRFHLLSTRESFYDELIRSVEPAMKALRAKTGNTALLSVREGDCAYCIHTVEPSTPMKFTARRGTPIPLYAGATGKVLLAYAPPSVLQRVLKRPLVSPRDGKPIDPEVLKKELEGIRCQGFAASREEWMLHAGDVSVPLLDEEGLCVAQLGVAGVAENIFERFDETLKMLKEAAAAFKAGHAIER